MSSRSHPVPADHRKATLFCPVCGHESRPDGDWVVTDDGPYRRYACPDCGATVQRRRRSALVA